MGQYFISYPNTSNFFKNTPLRGVAFSRGSYRGILVIPDKLISFSVKREFIKLFFVTQDLKVLHDPWRFWIINRYSWFYHSVLRDFETQVFQMIGVVNAEWFRYVISNVEPWLSHSRFFFFQTLCLVYQQVIKKSIAYFRDSARQIFLYSWSLILFFSRSWTLPETSW